jgi:tripartite-type tricarboxylate transporter receptor subunit TctC
MKNLKLPFSLFWLALAFCACVSGVSQAAGYPAKPIRLIIPAAPGGAVDTISRLLAQKLTTAFSQSVVPENHAGAGTMIASELVAKAAPDGYTVIVITNSHAINAAVRTKLRYDPIKDFSAVTLVAKLPDILIANPKVPYASAKELIAYARAHPGKVAFGSAGTGSGTDLDGELFKSMANIDLLHVPYKGGTPALTDVIGGRVQLMFDNPIGALPQIKAGKVLALAVTSAQRLSLLPDVPTLNEAGVPGYESGSWYGVLVPAGTPPAIITTLNTEILNALKSPDVRQALLSSGAEIVGSTPAVFQAYLTDDIARWKKVVEQNPQLRISE